MEPTGPVECPACGAPTPGDAAACPACGLDTALFGPVRAAAGGRPGGGPSDPTLLREILLAVGADPAGVDAGRGPGRLASPARFPAIRPRTVPPEPPQAAGAAPGGLPELPALESGEPVEVLSRQIEELTTLGRRLDAELSDLPARAARAAPSRSLPELEAIRRELFLRDAAALAEMIEIASGRRNELAPLLATGTPEAELEAARSALARGDLLGAHRTLRRAEDSLESLEEEWSTAQILSLEAELLVETLRELGGSPDAALGPLAAARGKARNGDRVGAEPLLARSVLALWHLTAPLLLARVSEFVATLDGAGGAAAAGRGRAALHTMAAELTRRNFGAAVMAYRSARAAVAECGADAPRPAAPS